MADEPQPLTPEERAVAVLRSQGHAIGRLSCLPAEIVESLASLCDKDGALSSDVRQRVKDLMTDYFASQKAVVELPTDQ